MDLELELEGLRESLRDFNTAAIGLQLKSAEHDRRLDKVEAIVRRMERDDEIAAGIALGRRKDRQLVLTTGQRIGGFLLLAATLADLVRGALGH